MIERYEIKKVNDKEVLYLYLNFNFEFSKMGSTKEYNNLKEMIKNYIKNNQINFKSGLVTLVISGMLIGNIVLTKEDISNNSNVELMTPDKLFSEVLQEEKNITKNNIENIQEESSEEKPETKPKELEVTENNNIESNNNIINYNISDTAKSDTTSNQNNSVIDTSSATITNETIIENNTPMEEIEDDNIYITMKRKNGTIVKIELEEYVIGVVGAEMPASFHIEALKSQAIIARTYALKANFKGETLTDNESTQSYKSNDELQALWGSSYNTYYNKIKSATEGTKGIYLTYNGTYIEAVYHSTSNGTTESSINVWENYYPYLVSVDSPYDNINSSFQKEMAMSYSAISEKLGITITKDSSFTILSKTSGNRVEYLSVDGNTYKGTDFRNLLGLRSTDFDISLTENEIIFTTRGYGHGVGLSQYGANGMAKNGYTYSEILSHYYPGTTLYS